MKRKNLYQNLSRLCLALFFLYLFFLPLFRGVIYPTERALFSLLLILIFSIFVFRESLKKEGLSSLIQWEAVSVASSVLLLACIAQTWGVSQSFSDSLPRLLDFVQLFFLFHFVRLAFDRQRRRKRLFQFFFALSLFHCLLALGYTMGLLEASWWEKPEFLSGTFVNHNHFAGFLELMIFLQIGMVLGSMGTRFYLLFSLIGFQTLIFFLSMSRGGWISFALTLFFIAILLIGQGSMKQLGVRLLGGLVLGLSIFFVIVYSGVQPDLTKRFNSFFEKEGQFEFLDFRVKLYKATAQAIEEKPLSGYGAGAFRWEMRRFRPDGFPYQFDFTHNDYLQFAMELGIPISLFGIGLVLWILILGISRFRSRRLQAFRFEELGLAGGVVCLLIHSLVDFNLHIYSNAAFFTVYLALLSKPVKETFEND